MFPSSFDVSKWGVESIVTYSRSQRRNPDKLVSAVPTRKIVIDYCASTLRSSNKHVCCSNKTQKLVPSIAIENEALRDGEVDFDRSIDKAGRLRLGQKEGWLTGMPMKDFFD